MAVVALLLLAGTVAVAWRAAGLPPPRYLLRYGLAPGCEPTGEVVTIEDVEFVVIGPGIFRMGSDALLDREGDDWWYGQGFTRGDLVGRLTGGLGLPGGKAPKYSVEMPVHWVEFSRGFAIARTEVTNESYRRFLEANPGTKKPEYWADEDFNAPMQPVVGVSYEEAERYCAWLAELSGREVRLPSESEWEAACRAGSGSEYAFGDDEADLPEYAWFSENSAGRAHAVGTKRANAWGLFDLHGNVWEWCADAWHDSYRLTTKVTGPDGRPRTVVVGRAPSNGNAWEEGGSPLRVIRGGCWYYSARYCRSAYRLRWHPGLRYDSLGFRPAFLPSDH